MARDFVPSSSGEHWRVRHGVILVGAALLLTQAVLLAWSSYIHSPTSDEIAYLPAGISHWRFGRFELGRANPPLVRLIAALPVLAIGCETDWTQFDGAPGQRTEFWVGKDFLKANGFRSFWLFAIARWACIPFVLLGGMICWRWAHELYGPMSGLMALSLWCFCPNVLGNGALITPDTATTSLGIAAAYTFWHWLRAPNWSGAWLAGLVLGFAELAKTNWLVLFALWPLLWATWQFCRRSPCAVPVLHQFPQLAHMLMLAIVVINAGYGFDGSFKPLGEFQFLSRTLRGSAAETEDNDSNRVLGNRFSNTPLAAMPVLLPEQYVIGIDVQKHAVERGRMAYLFGVWKFRGWWYYYLAAATVKVPVGIWVLLATAIAMRFVRRIGVSPVPFATFRDELVLLIPAIAVLAFISSQTGINRHFRYALPIFPFLYVWLSSLALLLSSPFVEKWPHGPPFLASRVVGDGSVVRASIPRSLSFSPSLCLAALTTAAWLSAIAHSLWVYPHSLSYFNEVAGGPRSGPRFLLDSNTDWGQDLLILRNWIEDHPEARPLYLAWNAPHLDPQVAGIEADPPDSPAAAGWHILSVNEIYSPHSHYGEYATIPPTGAASPSLYIFEVPNPGSTATIATRACTNFCSESQD
jgi:hypothetical protein